MHVTMLSHMVKRATTTKMKYIHHLQKKRPSFNALKHTVQFGVVLTLIGHFHDLKLRHPINSNSPALPFFRFLFLCTFIHTIDTILIFAIKVDIPLNSLHIRSLPLFNLLLSNDISRHSVCPTILSSCIWEEAQNEPIDEPL
jgi:hypothetical protein